MADNKAEIHADSIMQCATEGSPPDHYGFASYNYKWNRVFTIDFSLFHDPATEIEKFNVECSLYVND